MQRFFLRLLSFHQFFFFSTAVFLGWVLLVSVSWYHFVAEKPTSTKQTIRIGYMPVFSNAAAPLLKAGISQIKVANTEVVFQKFTSFAEMADAYRAGFLQGGFMVAPLALKLGSFADPATVVYIGNRGESTLVIRKGFDSSSSSVLRLAVPMRFSPHFLAIAAHPEIFPKNLELKILELKPPEMAAALHAGAVDAYFVGEPYALESVRQNAADVYKFGEQLEPGFICNVLALRDSTIQKNPEAAKAIAVAARDAALQFAATPEKFVQMLSDDWGLSQEAVSYAVAALKPRLDATHYQPVLGELEKIQKRMVEHLHEAEIPVRMKDFFSETQSPGTQK